MTNKKYFGMIVTTILLAFCSYSCNSVEGENVNKPKEEIDAESNSAKVYFTKDITPESLLRIYQALEWEAVGSKVAVKVSTGEPGGKNYLKPELIKTLVQTVNGTIIECNTAYGGKRSTTNEHLQTAIDHGFTAIADVDIMDAKGEVKLPVKMENI